MDTDKVMLIGIGITFIVSVTELVIRILNSRKTIFINSITKTL